MDAAVILNDIETRVDGLGSMPNWLKDQLDDLRSAMASGEAAVPAPTGVLMAADATLRDHIAIHALNGMIADTHVDEKIASGEWPKENVPEFLNSMSEWAYLFADKMLVRREMPPAEQVSPAI